MSPSKPLTVNVHSTDAPNLRSLDASSNQRSGSDQDLCIDDTAQTAKVSTLAELHAKQRKTSHPVTPRDISARDKKELQMDSIRFEWIVG